MSRHWGRDKGGGEGVSTLSVNYDAREEELSCQATHAELVCNTIYVEVKMSNSSSITCDSSSTWKRIWGWTVGRTNGIELHTCGNVSGSCYCDGLPCDTRTHRHMNSQ